MYLFDDWFDPIEACVRERVREFIGAMIEDELDATLLRPRLMWTGCPRTPPLMPRPLSAIATAIGRDR